MLKNYIKLAIRNITKSKLYAAVNIIGLAVGLACVLVIMSYLQLELSYDSFYENNEGLYRVTVNWEDDGEWVESAKNHSPLAILIDQQVTEVLHTARVFPYPVFISVDKINKSKETRFCFADSTFFSVFNFEVISGDLTSALNIPMSTVLTEDLAIKYFGSTDIVGKELFYEDERQSTSLTVTAVIENLPQNTHFDFEMLTSFSSLEQLMPWYNNWYHPPVYLYLEAKSAAEPKLLQANLTRSINDHLPDRVLEEKREFNLQSVSDIHLYSSLSNEWKANSDIVYVRLFAIIAFFILVVASINYMNLATARATERVKEIGMRKVLGAARRQLIVQFLGESIIITFIATALSFVLAEWVLLKVFNEMVSVKLSLNFILEGTFWLYTSIIFLIIGFLSGLYPALYLSSLMPGRILGGRKASKGAVSLRRGLVVFQFFITTLLIIGTLTVVKQTDFLRNKNLGFEKEFIIALKLVDRHAQTNYDQLKQKLLRESSIKAVALSSTLPGGQGFYGFQVKADGKTDKEYSIKTLGVDEDFLFTYGVPLVEGRDFSKEVPSDQYSAVIINRAAAEFFGWDEPIGKEVDLTIHLQQEVLRKSKVIGLVENFHFESLYKTIEPLIIYINKHAYYSDYLSVKFSTDHLSNSIDILNKNWIDFDQNKPMEIYFLDQELDKQYVAEVTRSKLFSSFATLSILISCLGIFGLATYTVQKRTKEIGIRKILGANVSVILKLVVKEYLLLVVLANIMAWPIAWYFMNNWLSEFVYKIDMTIWYFLLAILISVFITFLTISYQSLRAALSSPVNALRDE